MSDPIHSKSEFRRLNIVAPERIYARLEELEAAAVVIEQMRAFDHTAARVAIETQIESNRYEQALRDICAIAPRGQIDEVMAIAETALNPADSPERGPR